MLRKLDFAAALDYDGGECAPCCAHGEFYRIRIVIYSLEGFYSGAREAHRRRCVPAGWRNLSDRDHLR
jgi:hypothetical protein